MNIPEWTTGKSSAENRWYERAGLRAGCGVRSQVIDVLKAQVKRRPAMKKVSTAVAKQSRNCSQPKLTIGLDLGDRSSWYCLLDQVGEVLQEQKLDTIALKFPHRRTSMIWRCCGESAIGGDCEGLRPTSSNV
jgi:hypothetical protein